MIPDQYLWEQERKPRSRKKPAPELPDLFNQAPATKSVTSQRAAEKIDRSTLHERRQAAYGALRAAPHGLARFQIAASLGVPDHWVTSSVEALITQKLVVETGRKIVNPKSGKQCAVLALTEGEQ